ncbi:hypothetical protein CEV34_0045 [Brucella pseudogrignonensis]|uniref:Uncharacterized protein n=1 Tax=Brucella pseudogrignonensis TaxID=419475 RepID=A0A256GUV4_9HYPH|nr:hypothetical protein CEV34_0045 [Brucella pseudogrignonensis]
MYCEKAPGSGGFRMALPIKRMFSQNLVFFSRQYLHSPHG